MSRIIVMLAAETALSEQWMNKILIKAGIKVVPAWKMSSALQEKGADLLLCICENRRYLEKNHHLIYTCLQSEIPVIVAASNSVKCGYLENRKGCMLLRFPASLDGHEAELFERELLIRLKADYRVREDGQRMKSPSRWLVGIGASTGGPKALVTILKDLPQDFCAVLLVQHLTNGFSKRFAEYLSSLCKMQVQEARTGETVRDGTIYLAPDAFQTRVMNEKGKWVLKVSKEEKRGGFRPSVDCLFESLALAAGERAMGIILTGMGSDGAEGILKMRTAGAVTIGQDYATSDIYSMPQEAKKRGGIEKELPLPLISGEVLLFHRNMKKKWGEDTNGTIDFNCG